MQWLNSTLNSNVTIGFTSPSALQADLNILTSVNPDILNDSVIKINSSTLQL